jgi:hypothetical protein
MKKSFSSILVGLCVIILLIQACSFGAKTAGSAPTAVEPAKAEVTVEPQKSGEVKPTDAPASAGPAKAESAFPLPNGAKIISSTPDMVIASTTLKMADAIEFYRKDAKVKGFTEKEILTTITDNVFSIVFQRPNEEKELVIQGTVIAADNLTLSLRYEETDVK